MSARLERLAMAILVTVLAGCASGRQADTDRQRETMHHSESVVPTTPEGLAGAQEAASEATPPKEAVTLTWKAVREEGVYGYLVYRAERRAGPYRRVSDRIIRAPSQPADEPSSYRWVDRDAEPGRRYFYYLDVISNTGLKQRFSGILSKTVPPDDEGQAGSHP